MVLREVLSGGALLARGAKPVFRARGRREKAFREIKEGDYIKYIVTDCELLSRTNRISLRYYIQTRSPHMHIHGIVCCLCWCLLSASYGRWSVFVLGK
jgi:hypothetical protein